MVCNADIYVASVVFIPARRMFAAKIMRQAWPGAASRAPSSRMRSQAGGKWLRLLDLDSSDRQLA